MCAGVTTFVEELDVCAELAIMFPMRGSSAFFFAAVSGWAPLTHLTGVLGLKGFLCEPHHSAHGVGVSILFRCLVCFCSGWEEVASLSFPLEDFIYIYISQTARGEGVCLSVQQP